jgi:hypothetical protein
MGPYSKTRIALKRGVAQVIAGAMCVGCVGPFSEMVEREYEDMAATKAAGAVSEASWLPDILPDDATAIHEVHDIDTNETWGCFRTRELDNVRSALFRRKAASSEAPLTSGPREIFRKFSWWPDSMRSSTIEVLAFDEPPARSAIGGFAVRVGIDVTIGTVCFHRTR